MQRETEEVKLGVNRAKGGEEAGKRLRPPSRLKGREGHTEERTKTAEPQQTGTGLRPPSRLRAREQSVGSESVGSSQVGGAEQKRGKDVIKWSQEKMKRQAMELQKAKVQEQQEKELRQARLAELQAAAKAKITASLRAPKEEPNIPVSQEAAPETSGDVQWVADSLPAAIAIEARLKAEKRARVGAAKLRRQKAESAQQEEAEMRARFKKRDERLAKFKEKQQSTEPSEEPGDRMAVARSSSERSQPPSGDSTNQPSSGDSTQPPSKLRAPSPTPKRAQASPETAPRELKTASEPKPQPKSQIPSAVQDRQSSAKAGSRSKLTQSRLRTPSPARSNKAASAQSRDSAQSGIPQPQSRLQNPSRSESRGSRKHQAPSSTSSPARSDVSTEDTGIQKHPSPSQSLPTDSRSPSTESGSTTAPRYGALASDRSYYTSEGDVQELEDFMAVEEAVESQVPSITSGHSILTDSTNKPPRAQQAKSSADSLDGLAKSMDYEILESIENELLAF